MDKNPPIYAVNSVRAELAARFLVIQELKGGDPAQSRQTLNGVMSLWDLVVWHVNALLSNEVQVDW